jgi:hypothetical protein
MKDHVFAIGVLLMLSFALAGMTYTAAGLLRRFDLRFGSLLSLAMAVVAFVALIAALIWSVPPRA